MPYIFYIFVRKATDMETKLTLRLDDHVIERAKEYSKRQRISLSKMIESYLDSLTREDSTEQETEITPFIKSLSGVIDLPADFDYKKEYRDYITDKYQ